MAEAAARAVAELQGRIARAIASGVDGIVLEEIQMPGGHAALAEEEQKTAMVTATEIIQTAEAPDGIT